MSAPGPRFLPLPDVAAELNVSMSQMLALVRSGDLPAIKIGGRGQWRVERQVLEDWIRRQYAATRTLLAAEPAEGGDDADL